MKLLAVALLGLCLCGCKTVNGVYISVFDENTRFRVENHTGQDLHDVKIDGWMTVVGQGLTYLPAASRPVWHAGAAWEWTFRFPYGIGWIEIEGSSKEGHFKANYNAAIVPVPPSATSPPPVVPAK